MKAKRINRATTNRAAYSRPVTFYDKPERTPEGFLVVPVVIAQKGVLDYPEFDTKELLGDDIFSDSYLASCDGCPFVVDHPTDDNGEPIDVKAEAGTAVVFNALLLHSSSNPGFRRRVSCDIRFFPLCAFLPSTVHVLGNEPLSEFRRGLQRSDGPTLREPLLEAAAFMGVPRELERCEPYSVLNWSNFVRNTVNGNLDAALADLTRFVNTERGIDGVEAYSVKFHDRPIHASTLAGLLERLRGIDPDAPEVVALGQRVGGLTAAAR